MMTPGELRRRLWYWLHRDEVARELAEEMRTHVAFRAEALENAGVGAPGSQAAAYAAARRRFGNSTTLQQTSRDMWGMAGVENFVHDLRFALRRLRQRPAFTAAVVGVMAMGIGSTTATFSAFDAALLRPLPFRDPDQLAVLPVKVPSEGLRASGRRFERDDFTDVSAMHEVFTHVAAYSAGGLNLSEDATPLRVNAGVVTVDFFGTLGVLPATGRTFAPEEGVPGGANVAVLSHALWQRQYGGRDVSGLDVTLNKRRYRVVGVMPPGFSFPGESDLWIPMTVPTTLQTFEAFRDYVPKTVLARVAEGLTVADAGARLITHWQQRRPVGSARDSARSETMLTELRARGAAMPLQQRLAIDRRLALYALLGATMLLLLIACANVTNLLLAHASARGREIAVRQVLGATRARIVRQLLTESIVLALAGAVLGLLLSLAAVQLLRALMPPELAGLATARVDMRMLGFATTLAVVCGVTFGLWPAWGSAHRDSSDTIRSGGGHGTTSRRGGRVRRLLVGAELALTIVLLIGSGIMLRSFQSVVGRGSGMRTENVGTMEIAFPNSTPAATRLQTIERISDRLAAMPGVEAVGASKNLPFTDAGLLFVGIEVPGFDTTSLDPDKTAMTYEKVSGGYFPALGIPLREGRLFTDVDYGSSAEVAIVDETLARTYWPKSSAVGRTFRMAGDSVPLTVVGVVADVPHKLDDEPTMQLYHPLSVNTPFVVSIAARGSLPPGTLLGQMQEAVRTVDRTQPVFHLRMMEDIRARSLAPRRTSTLLIAAFALLALGLASVGVYAVVAHAVSSRSRELGIRSALGATGRDLATMVSAEMVWTAVIGIAVGLGAAWALTRTLASLVYGVGVHDPATFAIVPLVLLVPLALATLLPARRASRVNPADVMRAD